MISGKLKRFLKTIYELSIDYGLWLAVRLTVLKYLKNQAKYRILVKNTLEKEFAQFIQSYPKRYNEVESCANKIIWMFWWQGRDSMPEIVRNAFESVLKNCGDFRVVLLSEQNISEYYTIPTFLLEKYKQKKISVMHLSDVVRMELLKQYGGVWLDCTCFLSERFPSECMEYSFYSRHSAVREETVSEGRWTGYFLVAGKRNTFLFSFLSDFYRQYWENHDTIITYLMMDYMIDIAYRNFKEVGVLIDLVPCNNDKIRFLQENMNKDFDRTKWNEISRCTYLHKLAWRYSVCDNPNSYYNTIVNSDVRNF